jgi:hypothetical protein
MDKIRVLMLHLVYPLSISKYYKIAFKKRTDVDFKDCGVYTGSWIPWKSGMSLLEKYAEPPNYPLPFKPGTDVSVNYELVKAHLPIGWNPDLVVTINAGIEWKYKPSDGIVVSIGTDGHCLNDWYTKSSRSFVDHFFNMHPCYAMPGDKLLSYAFSSDVHYAMSDVEKDTDAVLIGMPYEQRIQWVKRLREVGVSVLFENGPVFDEYRELNNRARIGLNWPSMDDTNARVFELMAMKLCPVIKRTPDLAQYGFIEGEHYLGFSTLDEAVEKVLWAKNNPEWADAVALSAYNKVNTENWTYDKLVLDVLKETGLNA